MLDFQVKEEGVLALFRRVAGGLHDTTPLMRAIAGVLETQTENNFAAQGRPAWLGLSSGTLRRRGAQAKILQDTGRLAGSITTAYGRDFAKVGSNMKYAAVHQLGGTTRPHEIRPRYKKALAFGSRVVKKVNHPGSKIPARPFLPAQSDGNIQPAAQQAVIGEVQDYLRSLIG